MEEYTFVIQIKREHDDYIFKLLNSIPETTRVHDLKLISFFNWSTCSQKVSHILTYLRECGYIVNWALDDTPLSFA